MVAITGLYIAYEIAKGVGKATGANEILLGLADRAVGIAHLLQDANGAKKGVEADIPLSGPTPAKSTAQIDLDKITAMLSLLAHSEVTLNLKALRETMARQSALWNLGTLAFVTPDTDIPLYDLPSLRPFSALRHAYLRWDLRDARAVITGIIDRSGHTPADCPTTLDGLTSSREIPIAGDNDHLKITLTHANRSAATRIGWRQQTPVIRIHYISGSITIPNDELLAEFAVPVPRNRKSNGTTSKRLSG